MLIYRFESSAGFGIYAGSSVWRDICDLLNQSPCSHSNDSHPSTSRFSPHRDMELIYHFNSSFYCGFSSIEQLKRWFTLDEIKTLFKVGAVLKVYDTKEGEVYVSKYQAIFQKDVAECLNLYNSDSIELDTLLFND